MGERVVLRAARVVTPTGVVLDGRVDVVDGVIGSVSPSSSATDADLDLAGWLVPGFIDVHMHGGGGFDVTRSAEDMAAAVRFHRRHGTAHTLVSLMAQPIDVMCEQLEWVAALAADGEVLGAHLEGPFLSAARCGAQRPEHLVDPDPLILRKLLEAGQGWVRTMTIAPELPGALDLIRDLAGAGVVASVGHTSATCEQTVDGFDAGATMATHLFNAMGSFDHRAPGPAIAALDRQVFVELINDGVHVHDALVRLVTRNYAERVIFVTDAISATGVGDGEYTLGDQTVVVAGGQARLADGEHLAGSTSTMADALRRAVLDVGVPTTVAVAATSITPASALRVADHFGSIAPGRAADFVLLDENLELVDVLAAGRPVAPDP